MTENSNYMLVDILFVDKYILIMYLNSQTNKLAGDWGACIFLMDIELCHIYVNLHETLNRQIH